MLQEVPPLTSTNTKSKPGKRSQQGIADSQSWQDIFAVSKVLVSMDPHDLQCPHETIRHAQGDFLQNFGYQESDLPLPLTKLFGQATIRAAMYQIQKAILTKKNVCEFVNLYRANDTVLSCHVSVLSLTAATNVCHHNQSPSPPHSVRWAMLTIRSASVVGNSKFSGIGLLGTDRVSIDKRLREQPSSAVTTSKESTASTKKIKK